MLFTLLAAPLAAACSDLPIRPRSDEPVRVPIEVANNHVYVTVCSNGKAFSFILDTGAGATYFDIGLARAAGVATSHPFLARGAGAGTVEAAQIDGGSVRLAGTEVSEPVNVALDLSKLPPREGHAIDGILGHDLIERFVVAIDYQAKELRLYDRSWRYTGTGTSVPITIINNHPHVDAEFRLADGGVVKGRFIVDVGSGSSLALTKPVTEANHLRDRVGPSVHRPAGGGVGGISTGDIGRVASLRIGNAELLSPITVLFGDSAGVFTDNGGVWIGNIGGDVLRHFTAIFDYAAKRMILEPNASFKDPFETDMTGANIAGHDDRNHILVDYVLPGSPAAEAGLVVGDSVTAINGKPVGSESLTAWRVLSKQPSTSIELVVRRAGETKTVRFRTRRLV